MNAAQQLLGLFLEPWSWAPKGKRTQPPRLKYDPKINRWTGRPHEHKRENARRTTAPGTGIRRTLMLQARLRIFQD